MLLINQLSFLVALALLAVLFVMQTWTRPRLRPLGLIAAVLLLTGWWFLRPGAAGSADARTLTDTLGRGRPVVVEVYSDYCTTCLAAQPIMRGLEQDLMAQAAVLRLDVFSADGRDFMKRYGLQSLPAMVVLDPRGAPHYLSSGSLPDAGSVKQAVVEIAGKK